MKPKVPKVKRKGLFYQSEDRRLDNLYSGLKLTGKGKATAVLGFGGLSIYNIATIDDQIHDIKLKAKMENDGRETPLESLPGTYGDGQDYMSKLRDMQGQADLVFAMNKLRGGRF